MCSKWMFSVAVLLLATNGAGQDSLTIQSKTPQPQLEEEARAIYVAACATVQQEFGQSRLLMPSVLLVMGASEDGLFRERHEVRLRKWDRYLFAQAVVILAFDDLMPSYEKLTIAKRAVSWADATINAQRLRR